MALIDLNELYKKAFGNTPYNIPGLSTVSNDASGYTINGSEKVILQSKGGSILNYFYNGVEIWLPTWFRELPKNIGENGSILFPYTVVKISGGKTIIKTSLNERRGTVKEQFNIDDYKINIKGFLIDKNRVFPERELKELQQLFEINQPIALDNALINSFLEKSDRVVITSMELPEVEGGRKHVRPFSMELESDSVFTLELV